MDGALALFFFSFSFFYYSFLLLNACSLLDDPQVTGTPTFSPVASPHKGLPPRPPSHSRPPPPQSLDGLRHLHYTRSDYDKSPIKPKMWSESSLDEPYEKVKKRSSHSRYGRRDPKGSLLLSKSTYFALYTFQEFQFGFSFLFFCEVIGASPVPVAQMQVVVTPCRAVPSGASLTGIPSPACRQPQTLRPGPLTMYIPHGQCSVTANDTQC